MFEGVLGVRVVQPHQEGGRAGPGDVVPPGPAWSVADRGSQGVTPTTAFEAAKPTGPPASWIHHWA